jgi:hypothetical protein
MELKEAIEILKEDLEHTKKANECGLATKGEFDKEIEAIEFILNYITILNHITKQEKMIDLMAEELAFGVFDFKSIEQAKQYFEKKVEENK